MASCKRKSKSLALQVGLVSNWQRAALHTHEMEIDKYPRQLYFHF